MKSIRTNKREIALLCGAALFGLASLCASVYANDGLWFARSGAIMVLLAVVVDYRVAKVQQNRNAEATMLAGLLQIPMSGDLSKAEQRISRSAHILAIAGTVIWGYGDLII